ncbi:BspA family leucine-rich repeat surface protein, partial [Campylobacter jejuni]|uniref:BspA family leucine-rich repeat surface protein n=1 Tax=Campylobacter jejuni TaxID=197 RepID=UPI003B99E0BD
SGWDVRNIKNMNSLFSGCYAFNQDISGWNTSSVENMAFMFYNCTSFNQDLSSWDVSKVKDMSWMFSYCSSFNQPLGDWDVRNVVDMAWMFARCYSFNQDISKWNVSKVTNMAYMFKYCKINENFKPSNKKQKTRISELEKILNEIKSILSTIQIIEEKNVEFRKDMNIIAQHIVALRKTITQKKFTPDTKEELQALVEDESIYLGDIDTSKITDMSKLFQNSTRRDFSGIEKWDVSSVETMACMFSGCESFDQDISGWNTGNVKNMSGMFYCCHSFNQDLSSWDVSSVKNMKGMFEGCKNLKQSYRIKRR